MTLSRLLRWLLMGVGLLWIPTALIAQDTAPTADAGVTIHVVQRGETLFRIAQRYDISSNDLARLNGITNPNSIFVGQRLLVPTDGAVLSALEKPQSHTIRPGETLRSIAQFYGVSVTDLATMNQIGDPNTIYVGQVLEIVPSQPALPTEISAPAQSETPVPATEPESVATQIADQAGSADETSQSNLVHVVQRGETLFRIATGYGLTVNEVARANNIVDPTVIYVGQNLVIPNVEAPAATLDLPAPITRLDVIPQTLVEGQTVRVRLTTDGPAQVTGTFIGRSLFSGAEQDGTRHTLLQGVPMYTDAGVYPLELVITDQTGSETPFALNLQIAQGRYGSEYIRLLADRGGLLDPTVEDAELQLITDITGIFTPQRAFNGPMSLPAAATIISPFGTRRSYNGGGFDRFHSGTDFAGAPGTPILATAPGRVVLADTLNIRGKATLIDHGWGIFTGYWHQSEIYVQVGDLVSTGQVIGAIGATGRVTGAHLHWEVWAGGVPVDPMQWVRIPFV